MEALPYYYDLGYRFTQKYWGKGYATEAALACKEYAFQVLKYPAIFSYTTVKNIPSQTVSRKIGLEFYKNFVKSETDQIAQYAKNRSIL